MPANDAPSCPNPVLLAEILFQNGGIDFGGLVRLGAACRAFRSVLSPKVLDLCSRSSVDPHLPAGFPNMYGAVAALAAAARTNDVSLAYAAVRVGVLDGTDVDVHNALLLAQHRRSHLVTAALLAMHATAASAATAPEETPAQEEV